MISLPSDEVGIDKWNGASSLEIALLEKKWYDEAGIMRYNEAVENDVKKHGKKLVGIF